MTSREVGTFELAALRRMALTTVLLILIESGLGIVTNLYVTIPSHHPGAHPGDYFSGSVSSVAWSVAHGAGVLAVHVVFGIAIALMVVATSLRVLALKRATMTFWTALGALLVIAAGFNGASFLDFDHNISSLLMALLSFGAAACYSIVLSHTTSPRN